MKHSELRHQPRHVNPRIQDYELNASVLEEIILWISELKGEDDYDQTT